VRQAGAWVPAGGVSWLRSGGRELGALGQCAGLVVLDLVGECGVGGLCGVDLLADAPSGRGRGPAAGPGGTPAAQEDVLVGGSVEGDVDASFSTSDAGPAVQVLAPLACLSGEVCELQ
jgi:hypothetical protein